MKKLGIAAGAIVAACALVWIFDPAGIRKALTASRASSVVPQVDRLFAAWSKPDSPGCSVGVSRNGAVVYERGYGMANLELGVPITPASVFHVASISKQFTAMCILILAQRGRLSLEDDVAKYIEGWADRADRLTIRHLLTHTGGLRDGFLLRKLAAPREDEPDLNEAIVRLLSRQRALNFEPGAEFQYSNSGYAVLASIVKRVSGQSLAAFADANIFKPLGMTRTHIHDDPSMIVPNRASGYHRDAGGLEQLAVHGDLGHLVGTTGLFTTTRDLLTWEQNLADGRVGGPSVVAAMQAPTTLTGGATSSYGFGLELEDDGGLRTIAHGGGDPGYAAYVVRYPDQRLSVAVLCNQDNIGTTIAGLTRSVAHAFLGRGQTASPTGAVPTPPRVALSPGQLANKAGLYRDPTHETFARIIARDGKLVVAPNAADEAMTVELNPLGEDRFVVLGSSVVLDFLPAPADGAQELRVTGGAPVPFVMQRLATSYAPSRAELNAFAGEYTCPELDVTYALSVRDAELAIRIPGRAVIGLRPGFPDGFFGSLVGTVKFSRNARGGVTGFTVNAPAVRGVRFDRVNGAR